MTRLKQIRIEAGETQQQVATAIGMSCSGYTNIENGRRSPDITLLHALAEHFHVTTDYIIGLTSRCLNPEEQEFLQLFTKLPEAKQDEVIDYIEFLLNKEEKP